MLSFKVIFFNSQDYLFLYLSYPLFHSEGYLFFIDKLLFFTANVIGSTC